MIITGNSEIKRSVYVDENGFQLDVLFNLEPENIECGVSGDSKTSFKIVSGRFLDESGNFAGFYKKDKKHSIVYKDKNLSFLIDNEIYSCHKNREQVISGDSFLYIKNGSTGNASASVYLKSSKPSIDYSVSNTTGSYLFTGSFVNSSSKKVNLFDFTGNSITKISHSSWVNPSETGIFVYNSLETGDLNGSHNIDFIYNFGTENKDILYYNPSFEIPQTGILNYSLYQGQKNFSSLLDIIYDWETDTNLSIQFVYTSGSGAFYESAELFDAYGSGVYSGLVEGNGYIYSNDLVGTGRYSFYKNTNLFSGIASGSGGNGSVFYNLTGPLALNYSIMGSGIESGVMAEGYLNSELIVNLVDADSGRYTFTNYLVTGTPLSSNQVGGGAFFDPATGVYTGYLNGEYILEKYISINSGSSMVGATTNVLTNNKTLTGVFTLTTGFMGEDAVNYYTNNLYSGNTYSGTSYVTSGLKYIQAELYYLDPLIGSKDYGKFIVSNGIITEEIEFYGL